MTWVLDGSLRLPALKLGSVAARVLFRDEATTRDRSKSGIAHQWHATRDTWHVIKYVSPMLRYVGENPKGSGTAFQTKGHFFPAAPGFLSPLRKDIFSGWFTLNQSKFGMFLVFQSPFVVG
jgi:hypothetical protein